MALLTKREEHVNRIVYLPKTIMSVVTRVASQYMMYDVSASTLELDKAIRSIEDLKRSIIYLKNARDENAASGK
jgi:hypothetical protein